MNKKDQKKWKNSYTAVEDLDKKFDKLMRSKAQYKKKMEKYGAPRKCRSASSCKCCRKNADPAYFVSNLGQVTAM